MRRARDLRAASACAERSNGMASNDGKGDGERVKDAMRERGEFPALALNADLHSHSHGIVQQDEAQKIAAVAGNLSSTESTPAGTPYAKRSNVSSSPMHSGAAESMVAQQHAMMAAIQAASPTMKGDAERRAEEKRASIENDETSECSVSFARMRHIRTLPHASPMPSGMALHTVLL